MSGVRITVVLHPWQADREERDRLVSEAAALAGHAPVEVWVFTGQTHPAAVAARLSNKLADIAVKQLVLLSTGTESEAIAALLAGQLGGISLGRCSALKIAGDTVVARRAAFGGRVELALRSDASVTCATLRPQGMQMAVAASIDTTEIVVQEPAPYRVEPQRAVTGPPRVEGASTVVSGGRGIGGPEGFEWLTRIAVALSAGLGGSLPAVDAGWVPVAHQVGQSGKFVTPKLYFAVGISGTPQHLAGVSPNARIVALNNDRDAAIFSRCDVAVEGDWREILPLLTQILETEASPR
jgi:electron transfer flavoprotein alpha subunit